MSLPILPPTAGAAQPRPMGPAPLDPYRVLFPLGLLLALLAALVWPLAELGWIPYPGLLHVLLMIEGYQQCFVLGLLLTAIRAFTKAERAHPIETATSAAAMLGVGALALAGLPAAAHACFLASVATLAAAVLRRLPRHTAPVPNEVVFVLAGLLLGLVGGAALLADAAGWLPEPTPRLGVRLVSVGMMVALVLGVGGVLVPTFTGMAGAPQPVAAPQAGGPRRPLTLVLALVLALSFVADASGRATAGAWARALAVTAALLFGWRLQRLPGRRDRFGLALWSGGWLVLAGLWVGVALPARPMLGLHVAFIAGFGLLTLSVASRVTTVHGALPPGAENRMLSPLALGAWALALAMRIGAEQAPAVYFPLLAASGGLWALAWLAWGWRALPTMVRGPAAPGPR